MENVKSKKERRLMRLMVVAWIMAATLGGCVVSLNIQKNNQNSTQSVSQENEATQKNDSTNFNMDKKTEEIQDYTEQYAGIIMLRKGRIEDYDVWFGTVGNQLVSDGNEQKIMENVKSKKERRLIKLLVVAWVLAATLGGCVISPNIQKNNNNSEQKVDQNASANQENDSTNFNIKMK